MTVGGVCLAESPSNFADETPHFPSGPAAITLDTLETYLMPVLDMLRLIQTFSYRLDE